MRQGFFQFRHAMFERQNFDVFSFYDFDVWFRVDGRRQNGSRFEDQHVSANSCWILDFIRLFVIL